MMKELRQKNDGGLTDYKPNRNAARTKPEMAE
jgi:hypothetical protein